MYDYQSNPQGEFTIPHARQQDFVAAAEHERLVMLARAQHQTHRNLFAPILALFNRRDAESKQKPKQAQPDSPIRQTGTHAAAISNS